MSETHVNGHHNGGKKAFHNFLKETVGVAALATVPADPEKKNVPKQVAALLEPLNQPASLSIPESTYKCITQDNLPVAPAPGSEPDPLGLWVGWGGKIPRWKKGQTVNWAVLSQGFPSFNHAIFSAYKFNEAAIQWNGLNVGVQFKWVNKLEDACFVLAYGGDLGSVLAKAFFPNPADLSTVYVYQRAFDDNYAPYQTNIFVHELGHVLGLRHEFAESEGGAVQFGPANPLSVMSYTFPPNIRDSDETWTKKFYDYTGPAIGGLLIQDWIPDN